MQSRRDQVHSYQFFLHRVISALVARESDPAELPFRRLGGAAFGSLMVAVLALGAVGVYGYVVGGGAKAWRSGDAVIVEKESGTRYVYRDGRLHPVLNLASARLLIGRSEAKVTRVSAKSLVGVPRGPVLGIPGAPDGTFDNGRLLTEGWTLCSELLADGRGGQAPVSLLGVGRAPVGGTELAHMAVLVRDMESRTHDLYLLWNNHRFAIADTDAGPVLQALGDKGTLSAASAWLNALPVGTALVPRGLADPGTPTAAFERAVAPPAFLVGQVVTAPSGAFYRVRAQDLEQVTALQKDILLASRATTAAYPGQTPRVLPVEAAVLATARVVGLPEHPAPNAAPATRPEMMTSMPEVHRDGMLCASTAPGKFTAQIHVGASLPGGASGMATPRRTTQGALLADRVLVQPGWAALVESVSSAGAAAGSLHLVTDQGVRHALPGIEVAKVLGYRADRVIRVPAGLVDRIPVGPALTPEAAKQPASTVNPVQSSTGTR